MRSDDGVFQVGVAHVEHVFPDRKGLVGECENLLACTEPAPMKHFHKLAIHGGDEDLDNKLEKD